MRDEDLFGYDFEAEDDAPRVAIAKRWGGERERYSMFRKCGEHG